MGLNDYGFGNTYKTNWMGLFFLVLIAITIGLVSYFYHSKDWPEPVAAQALTNTYIGMDREHGDLDSMLCFPVVGAADTLQVYTLDRVEFRTADGQWVRGSLLDEDVILRKVADMHELTKRAINAGANKMHDRGYYFISRQRLTEACLGRTFQEIDGKYRIAEYYMPTPDGGGDAYFPFLAMLLDTGFFFDTHMHFDAEGRCTAVEPFKRLDRRNEGLLRKLPFVQTIMSWDWFTWFIQESPCGNYRYYGFWLWKLLIAVFYMIVFVFWFLLPPLTLLALFYTLLPLNAVKWVPNYVLSAVGIVLTIVGCYVWMVGLLAWGMYAICCVLFVGYAGVIAFTLSASTPSDVRCPKCHAVGTQSIISTRLIRNLILNTKEYVDKGYDHTDTRVKYVVYDKVHIEETTYTGQNYYKKVTYRTPYKEKIKYTYRDIYNLYDEYAVKYKTPVLRGKVRCSGCGHVYEGPEFEGQREEISRQYTQTVVRLKETRKSEENLGIIWEGSRREV
ncbi:MAG: hypothetical protein IJQ59_07390 [Bacteroidaceae bacterium]|nr:hypothetical protein [Bacteroidaceae bacterium]